MTFAYWRKCDFQIHTPRDPSWHGRRPIGIGEDLNGRPATVADVDRERSAWATDFIAQCEQRGLEAIALTDHHEMIFIPYVQAAIKARKAADATFDLWLFPGMELTCHGGVQSLILFDADISEDWLTAVRGKLGTVTPDHHDKDARGPARVDQLAYPYPELAEAVDSLGEGIRGKYIILPNVSQGNAHTVLTDGSHADFKRMPYVGAYVDHGQNADTLLPRNRRRLSGTDKTWSDRFIYPLPTSDSRSADYATLGDNSCWIKLAAPTAEAVRQAFLGYRSRIAIAQPSTASLSISAIKLTGSTILHETTLELSPEQNSLIGGRGSGKSSMLEYIAFGLGRSCYDLTKVDYTGSERMSSLVEDTLLSVGGTVELTINQDGAEFVLTRGPGSAHQPQVTYPNGSIQPLSTRELRALFPAVVYSQGELSELGKQAGKRAQLTDLLQFVNPDYKKEDDQLKSAIDAAKEGVRTAVQRLSNAWRLLSDLHKLQTAKSSLDQRILALQKTLPALSETDQGVVNRFEVLSAFEGPRAEASLRVETVLAHLTDLWKSGAIPLDIKSELPEAAAFLSAFRDFDATFKTGLTDFGKSVAEKRSQLDVAGTEWSALLNAARADRDAVMAKLGAHKAVTGQISALQVEAEKATLEIAELNSKVRPLDEESNAVNSGVAVLKEIVRQRGDRTAAWAKEIERLSAGKIKATLNLEGDWSDIRDAVDTVASKTGSQEANRQRQIEESIGAASAWDFIDALRAECISALYYKHVGSSQNGEKPSCDRLLKTIGGTERTHSSCMELMDLVRVEAIATAVPKPDITLSYIDGDRSISFEKASEGQRAAALLFMLLQQVGGPLLVDQPEGDLDNSVISELTDLLHDAKQKRQIIFASHNANVVVNGSSELVSQLEVKNDGKRQFACIGAIDEPIVCKTITETMEGGEKAFRDRQIKYGY